MQAEVSVPKQTRQISFAHRWAWAPVPLLAAAIAVLWHAATRDVYESHVLLFFLNLPFVGLVSACIAWLAGRGALATGQGGLLMLGCAAILFGSAGLIAPALIGSDSNAAITIHNLGVFGSAACHLFGLAWRRPVKRPGRALVVAFGGAVFVVVLLTAAALGGLTPVFFVQGRGGTAVRQIVLLATVLMFTLASWRMLRAHLREASPFLYWYGLGLALLALGLIGVMLHSVHSGALGWTGRAAQWLGGIYMLTAAIASSRETGEWKLIWPGALREALRRSEARLDAVLETLPVGVVIADAGGRIVRDNAATRELWGVPPETQSWEQYGEWVAWWPQTGERIKPHEWAMTRALREGKETRGELILNQQFGTGEKRYYLNNVAPLRDRNGRIAGGVAAMLDVTAQIQAEERIKAALEEKEVLLREIHHRVKNNMQVISSLASLQADDVEDEAVKAALLDITHRVRSMAMVHEKLYESPNLARVDFADYAEGLLNYLWQANSLAAAVRLELDLAPVLLPVDKAVPCGLVLNELAGNALKHAFVGREAGVVGVSLDKDAEGRVRLSVWDNGLGLPAGLDWKEAHSLGLRLVQMLARQLKAELEYEADGGCRFSIVFAC